MERYGICEYYENKHYIRRAESPIEAIEKLSDQYGWGPTHDVMVDADTRGAEWCRCKVGWGGGPYKYFTAFLL